MAEVRVPATWFARGYLPQTCARHSGPASSTRKRTFYTRTPPWLYLLLLGSVLLFAIVALIMRKTVEGALPGCAQCAGERRRYVLSVLGAWVASLALFISAGFTASLALIVVGGIAVVAAVVWSCLGDQLRVRGSLSKDQVWLELRGVNESFAMQIDQAVQGATPAPIPAPAPTGYGAPAPALTPNAAATYGGPGLAPGSPAVAPTHIAGSAAGRDILPGR
jgi:hypothetical protein